MKLPDRPRWQGPVQEEIEAAMERGDFSNLRGKGRPLDVSADLADPKHMRTKLRRDAGFTAPWEDVGREIARERDKARRMLLQVVEFRRAGLSSPKAAKCRIEADYALGLERVRGRISAVNSLILKHNLIIPRELPHLHRPRLKLAELMEEVAPEWVEPE